VISDVHVVVLGVELAVDGRRVREKRHSGLCGFLCACVVVEGAVGSLHEPVTDLEGLVGEVARLPYSEAAWIAVPVVVWLGNVAHVVDLLARVVLMNIFGLAIDGTLEFITAVLDTPQAASK
jgi:hypothetical protein